MQYQSYLSAVLNLVHCFSDSDVFPGCVEMEGVVVRRVIPSDNSCLFNAVGYDSTSVVICCTSKETILQMMWSLIVLLNTSLGAVM